MTWFSTLRLWWHHWRFNRAMRKMTAGYQRLGESSQKAAAAIERLTP